MQTTTSTNCPTNRVKATDARDGATYWIRKIPGTKAGGGDLCWMETNLAYAGGGDNTYGDATTPITEGSADAYATPTEARYYTPLSSNRTTGDTNPSTSTDGGITNPQYGYLYNWCAAMAGQPDACQYTTISQPNQSANPGNGTIYNVCPAGWRLPTGNTGGEFANLNNAINGGRTDTDAGLRANSLYMYSGEWGGSFTNQGSNGIYWSSTSANPTNAGYAYYHLFNSYRSDPLLSYFKRYGFAVRCVAE